MTKRHACDVVQHEHMIMATSTGDKLVYEKDSVFIHSEDDRRTNNVGGAGKLRIMEYCYGTVIEWIANEKENVESTSGPSANDSGWDLLDPGVGFKFDKANADTLEVKNCLPRPITCEIVDLKSMKMSTAEQGWPFITLLEKDGTTHPTLHFHSGGKHGFLETLSKYVNINQSTKDPDLYIVQNPRAEALQKSLTELDLFREHTEAAVHKFMHNPYAATMTGFSKVTNLVYKYMAQGGNGHHSRPDNEMMEYIPDNIPSYDFDQNGEPGFEIISCNELGNRPSVTRGEPLTADQWICHFDEEGRLTNEDELKKIIFQGGVVSSIRSEVWKFLLGYSYSSDYASTLKERQEERRQKTDDYFRMKLQWKSFTLDQQSRFAAFRENRSLIDKDVIRTDRTDKNYAGEDNQNIALLSDILMTYCMYNFDLGYVQGMSDLLSPLLLVMENEVDTFWSFANFMKKIGSNFEMDQQGIKTQLQDLHTLLNYLDPELSDYLDKTESGNLYFCFRWLLVLFKREFKFHEIMQLWEVFWTGLPCKNFHLLFCLAILDTEKNTLTENKFGFTEILKHMNDLSHHIKLEDTLCKAESLYLQIKNSKYVPTSVTNILGLPSMNPSPPRGQVAPTVLTPVQSNLEESLELEKQFETALNLQYS